MQQAWFVLLNFLALGSNKQAGEKVPGGFFI